MIHSDKGKLITILVFDTKNSKLGKYPLIIKPLVVIVSFAAQIIYGYVHFRIVYNVESWDRSYQLGQTNMLLCDFAWPNLSAICLSIYLL